MHFDIQHLHFRANVVMTFKLIQQFIYLCCICGSLKALDWASDTAGYKGKL